MPRPFAQNGTLKMTAERGPASAENRTWPSHERALSLSLPALAVAAGVRLTVHTKFMARAYDMTHGETRKAPAAPAPSAYIPAMLRRWLPTLSRDDGCNFRYKR